MPQLQTREPLSTREHPEVGQGESSCDSRVEGLLRDMAFVLQATRKVREAILEGRKN